MRAWFALLCSRMNLLFPNLYLGSVCECCAVFLLLSLTKLVSFSKFSILSMVRSVFVDIYHFNLNLSRLRYVAFVVSGTITYAFYCLYLRYHLEPWFIKKAHSQPKRDSRSGPWRACLSRFRCSCLDGRHENLFIGSSLLSPRCHTSWDFLDFSKYFDVSLHSAFEVYRVGANNDLFRYIVLLCGIRRTLLMIIFWGV